MTTWKFAGNTLGALLLGGLLGTQSASAQTPLLEYLFDETGTSALSTGSAGLTLTLKNASAVATDLHSPDGTGVKGWLGYRAFDNSASSAMGSLGTGGRGEGSGFNTLGDFSSFTLMGWMNNASTIFGNGARIFQAKLVSDGVDLQYSGSGQLLLTINGINAALSSAGSYSSATSQWTFFAASFDGTAGANQVKYYVGTDMTPVSLESQSTLAQALVTNVASAFYVGNSFHIRPFDGWLDNIRFFASAGDGSGALTLSQLESFRILDIPEPTSVSLLLIAAGVFGCRWLRCRR
jgi:hypothetical protein